MRFPGIFSSNKLLLVVVLVALQYASLQAQQVSGKVTADAGQPISGALVTVQAKGGIQTVVSTTGQDGEFTITGLKTDQALLSVEKGGRLLFRSIVSTKAGNPIDISLPSPFHLPNWQPSDLAPDPVAGVLVLDTSGQVSRITNNERGSSREIVFSVPRAYTVDSIAANGQAIFAVANSAAGCTVFRYVLMTRSLDQKAISAADRCSGIATDGEGIYVASGKYGQILYWDSWISKASKAISVASSSTTSLAFDPRGNRLLLGDAIGRVYSVPIPEGKSALLTSDAGWVASLAANSDDIFVASGKKILVISRATNLGENPPPALRALTGGTISGVAFDAQGRLWFTDYDKGIVDGPLIVK